MSEFLFEIFSEEIPARMQEAAQAQLKALAEAYLKKQKFSYSVLETFGTPRRLTLRIADLTPVVTAEKTLKKGPLVAAGEEIFQKFCQAQGVSPESCFSQDTPRGPCWFATWEPTPPVTEEMLPLLCLQILQNFSWPKRMRWGGHEASWIRPVRRLLCLYQGKPLVWEWAQAGLVSGDQTEGHRFAPTYLKQKGDGEKGGILTVSGWQDYVQQLHSHYVILDPLERKKIILQELQTAAAAWGAFLARARLV